jgi:hypothetical protein
MIVTDAVTAAPGVDVAELRVNTDSSSRSSRSSSTRPGAWEQQQDDVLLKDYAHGCTPPSALSALTILPQ